MISPLFVLFLDAVAQLVRMNPFAFEFVGGYLAFLAYELYTNRFFEFVQSDVANEDDNPTGLPSAFSYELNRKYLNKAFERDWESLTFDARGVEYWDEFFGRF
jgi:hypothetical protein